MKIAVVVATLVTITINLLSNVVPYNNKTTAQVSDSFAVYFVPAGYVFAIWGIIYLGIIAYAFYQFKFAKQENADQMSEIASWYLISCLANSIWLFLWHYEYIVATIFMMALLLISLIGIYLEIKKVKVQDKKFSWMVKIPFSIYLGWITVATVANAAAVIFVLGYDGGNYATWWTVGMMGVAALLAVIMILRERNYAYPMVIIWAIIGIAVKFNLVSNIVWAVVVYVAIIVITMLLSLVLKKDKQNKK